MYYFKRGWRAFWINIVEWPTLSYLIGFVIAMGIFDLMSDLLWELLRAAFSRLVQ
jgi:hypothetical protein